ncbi:MULTISPECIES: STAS domain-containing protein [Mycobacteriaceae]|uniref:STAS domain-containing protein n=1 Tax=Mycobacteriaceae TaxID=1762 RepID=UPI0007FC85A9|nr:MULTISPECIES: STAS domain-containing protein [Mycobacteriaceae]MCK0173956.1 STAS domain-containing protein [Mycolicibacterium sp. F2034L]OBB56784.1 anti-anti-sigma factor [Mycobacterium sp. 852013-51886_SCH5428379]
MADIGTVRVFRPDPAAVEKPERRGRASYAISAVTPTLSVIAVTGEIDATNGRDLGRYVEQHTATSTQLILDCTGVVFFGSQGFSALHYTCVSCARMDVDWVIVPGREVRRLLRICDPHGELPLADSLEAARRRLDRVGRRLNQVQWAG